jgi:hypothetical protein
MHSALVLEVWKPICKRLHYTLGATTDQHLSREFHLERRPEYDFNKWLRCLPDRNGFFQRQKISFAGDCEW